MATILLIEDNLPILENLTEYLELEGFTILAAEDGKKGIALAVKHIPDLIICDTKMPVMDGYEVLRVLQTMSKTYEIPFIFSTSNAEVIDRAKALEMGADEYIIKPFDPESLLKIANICLLSGSKRHFDNSKIESA